jgi:hypothetical protein
VTVDGIPNGITPVVISGVLPGTHGVTLSSEGYEDWNYMVSVRPAQTSEINAVLVVKKENTGSLAVITEPTGAEISVDGIFKGVSPVTIAGLTPTTHNVVITLKGYSPATTNISITPGQTQKYTLDLQKNYTLSSMDLLLAGGVIVMIAVIAIIVMVKKDPKKK